MAYNRTLGAAAAQVSGGVLAPRPNPAEAFLLPWNTMYAIVKTGGKQYRVEEGQSLLVERLSDDEGAKVALEPLLYRGDDEILDGDDLDRVKVEAKVLAHERGPKLRVFKYKPKRGYRKRTGHRQDLTRLEVTQIKLGTRKTGGSRAKASGTEGDEGKRGSNGS